MLSFSRKCPAASGLAWLGCGRKSSAIRSCLAAALAFGAPAIAHADERAFCADRPGLGTPPCTLAPGTMMIEVGLAGWDHSGDAAQVSDDWSGGDVLLRIGIDERTELQVGQSGFTANRIRDRSSGQVARVSGLGDTTIAIQRGLAGANGAVAVQAFLTLPTGHAGIGAGTWAAGAKLPVALALHDGFELDLTPEVDAAADASGAGRHFTWGGVVGLGHAIGPSVSAELEVAGWRDLDPAGHQFDARAALSLAWQAGRAWQIDAELDQGLSAAAPDQAIRLGLAHRF